MHPRRGGGPRRWPAAAPLLLQAGLAMNVLQWNPHWECFVKDRRGCREKAKARLNAELVRGDIDFANVVELSDDTYVAPTGWKAINHTCGKDIISLIYNVDRWRVASVPGSAAAGCMVPKDRPFIVQLFAEAEAWGGKRKVIFVGAHYPHTKGRAKLRDALGSVIRHSGELGVVLAADTNEGHTVSSEKIMRDIQAPVGSMVSTALHNTCCHSNDFKYRMPYDRIIANFGLGMNTSVMLDSLPEWAQGSFHKGIRGTLREVTTETSTTTTTTTTTATTSTSTTTTTTQAPTSFGFLLGVWVVCVIPCVAAWLCFRRSPWFISLAENKCSMSELKLLVTHEVTPKE